MKSVQQLVQEISQAEASLTLLKAQLTRLQQECTHKFGETKYVPHVTEAYTISGDRPRTMGIDWRGPTTVPREETKNGKEPAYTAY